MKNGVWIVFPSYYKLQKWTSPETKKSACMKKRVWIAFLPYYRLCKNGLVKTKKGACIKQVVWTTIIFLTVGLKLDQGNPTQPAFRHQGWNNPRWPKSQNGTRTGWPPWRVVRLSPAPLADNARLPWPSNSRETIAVGSRIEHNRKEKIWKDEVWRRAT